MHANAARRDDFVLSACHSDRLGRAMLRPIFDQKSRKDGKVSQELEHALRLPIYYLLASCLRFQAVCAKVVGSDSEAEAG